MRVERNEALKPSLEALRQETERLFNEARALETQWGHLEVAQSDDFKVCFTAFALRPLDFTAEPLWK